MKLRGRVTLQARILRFKAEADAEIERLASENAAMRETLRRYDEAHGVTKVMAKAKAVGA